MKGKVKRSTLFTLFLIVFIDLVGVGVVIPVLAPLMLDVSYGLAPTAWSVATRNIVLGFLIGIYPIMQFFGAPILGTLSDRFGRKKILIFSLFGTLIGYVLFAIGILLGQLWLLFASRALDGFTGGNIAVANSAVADISDEKSKAKNFGLIGMAFGLGFILGPFIGGKLSDPNLVSWFNVDTPFWFISLLTLANLIFLIAKFPETLKETIFSKISITMGFQNMGKAFREKNLRIIFAALFFQAFGFSFFTQFFPVFLFNRFDYSPADIGMLFAYIGLWIAISQGLIVRFVNKVYSSEQVLRFSIIMLAMAIFLTLIPNKASYLLLTQALIAIFAGLTFPNATALISKLSGNRQGEMLGINQSLQAIGHGIPPIISGFIVNINQNLPILTAVAFTVLSWLIYMLFYKRHRLSLNT